MTTAQLATRPTNNGNGAMTAADYWNDEQKRAIRDQLVPADKQGNRMPVSDAQLALFAQVCKLTDLDPFTGQIFLIPLDGVPKPFIGINGLRAIGARCTEGVSSQIFWKSRGGDWEESWDEEGTPFAAMAVIKRGNSVHRSVVHWSEFPAKFKNADRPAHWIGTVAERHGWRKACPLELSRTLRAAASAGAIVQDSDDEPELPATAAPRQITAPASRPMDGTRPGPDGQPEVAGPPHAPATKPANGTTRDHYVKGWNKWTARAVLAGVEWEDLIPDFALDKATEADLGAFGPQLRQRVEAAEAAAAARQGGRSEDPAPIDAELRETPATDEPTAVVEFGEPPTLEQIQNDFARLGIEASALHINYRVPGPMATAKDYADAIASLEPKVVAARAKARK